MNVNIADGEALAAVNGFHATQTLRKPIGQGAVQSVQGGRRDVERRFPEAQHLGEAVAVVGVLVGDEDTVDVVDGSFDSGESGQRFALAKTGVNEEAGTLGLKQRD